jgi:predicted nucleic acid-binding protein
MNDRVFLDTNILVYAYDTHEPDKRKVAQDVVKRAVREDNAAISTQVLGEFFTIITRKIKKPPLGPEEAQKLVSAVSIIQVVETDLLLVNRAIDAHRKYGISYWDSLIVAAAERASCKTVLSEDLSHRQRYYGISVLNPFASLSEG